MGNIYDIINNTDTKLQQAVRMLAESIIHSSSLTIQNIEEIQLLQENKIISIDVDGKYKIEMCDRLIFSLLKVYEQKGMFVFSDNPENWQTAGKYLKNIKGFRWEFENIFYQFTLQYFDAVYPEKLNTIILSDKLDTPRMLRGLNTTITSLHILPNSLYELIQAITEKGQNFFGFIRPYCRNNYQNGCEFKQLIIDNFQPFLNNALIACISGLFDNDYEKTKEFSFGLYDNDDLRDQITYSFTNCISQYPDKSRELYEKVSAFSEYRCDATLIFYWEVYRQNSDLQEQCEVKLLDIIDNASGDLLCTSIEELMYSDSVSDFIREYINRIVCNDEFTMDHIKILDTNVADQICDSMMLTNVIRGVSRFGLEVSDNVFEQSIRSVSEKEPKEFADAVISFITDNNGIIRHIGRKIWDCSNLVNSNFDPLSLPIELQFRFIVSMLQDLGNPRYRLKKVLLLFDSSIPQIPQLLLMQLIPYVNNYMGAVMAELESLQLKNSTEITKFKEYYMDRCNFIDRRVACKELNPLYTQCKVLNEFKRNDQEYTKGIMKDAEQKSMSPLRELFTTVILAKGGGFRNRDGSVQDLANISHSVPFPVMYASLNEIEESKLNTKIFADWYNVTDIWKIL